MGRLRKAFTGQALTVGQTLSPDSFRAYCSAKPGIFDTATNTCIFESYRNELGSARMDSTTDYDLTNIASGSAVLATGYVTGNAVEILVNNTPVSKVPSAGNRPVATNGGKLGYRFRQGEAHGVKVFVYSCVNSSLVAIRCPY